MVSALFTAFALIAAGQAETVAAEPTSMENTRSAGAVSPARGPMRHGNRRHAGRAAARPGTAK